jgi:hypothetical protein
MVPRNELSKYVKVGVVTQRFPDRFPCGCEVSNGNTATGEECGVRP